MAERSPSIGRIPSLQWWPGAAILAMSLSVASCSDDDKPCSTAKSGGRYDMQMVERWDRSSQFLAGMEGEGCPAGFDLSSGDILRIHVVSKSYDEQVLCWASVFTVENPEAVGWEILATTTEIDDAGSALLARLSVHVQGCRGLLSLDVERSNRTTNIFEDSVPGSVPNFTLMRRFRPDGACPVLDPRRICTDLYVVSFEPVE